MPPILSGSDAPVSGKSQALMKTRGIHLRCRSPPTLLVIVSGGPRRGGTGNVKYLWLTVPAGAGQPEEVNFRTRDYEIA